MDPRRNGTQSEFVVEMNIRHQRHRTLRYDVFQSLSRCHIRHGKTHDLTPAIRKRTDLLQSLCHIFGRGIRHRLYGNRCTVTDRHLPHIDPATHFPFSAAGNARIWGISFFTDSPFGDSVFFTSSFPSSFFCSMLFRASSCFILS